MSSTIGTFADKADLDKKNVKILRSFSRYFGIKPPYKIIIGPYFCQIVAEKRISLIHGIKSVFIQRYCELYTTRCCINDLQKLIAQNQPKFIPGAHILRTLNLLPCLHKQDPKKKESGIWDCVNSIDCMKMYINGKYCFAMQPRSFLQKVRATAGTPSIWMYESAMVLDKLSKASKDWIEHQRNKYLAVDSTADTMEEEEVIDLMEQLDDQQNNDKDKGNDKSNVKESKGKKRKRREMKRYTAMIGENRIVYGPNGGYDVMGTRMAMKKRPMRMKKPATKKRKIQPPKIKPAKIVIEPADPSRKKSKKGRTKRGKRGRKRKKDKDKDTEKDTEKEKEKVTAAFTPITQKPQSAMGGWWEQ